MAQPASLGEVVVLLHQAADLVWEDADLSLGIAHAAMHAATLLPADARPELAPTLAGATGSRLLQAALGRLSTHPIVEDPGSEQLRELLLELLDQARQRGL